jgi:putative ABC transport system permease protein
MAIRTVDVVRSVRHTFSTSKLRVGLTLLGIMIGSGSMVLLAGLLVAGKEALVRLSQGVNESDLIEIQQQDVPKKDLQKTTRPLSTYDADALDDSPLLDGAHVNAAARKHADLWFGSKKKATSVFAAEKEALSLYRISVEQGRYFSDDDYRDSHRVAIVGQEIWTDLLEKKKLADAPLSVTVDGVVFQVIGVLAHKPTMSHGNGTWMWNRRTMIPSSTYRSVFATGDATHSVGGIFVRLQGDNTLAGKAKSLTDIAEKTLLRRHNNVKNFSVQSDARGQDQEELILKIIAILLFGTGVVALFVGGINIMNIMLVTVTERTREIGIRRAVGATPGEIARQFILEAAVLAGTGGLLGVVGGIALTFGLSLLLSAVLAPWRFVVEPWAVALALGMAAGTGIAFGWFPAMRASKLDPVEALRSD